MEKRHKFTAMLLFSLCFFLLSPLQGFALDFSIPHAEMEAFLQEDGHVHVKETYTYLFDGSFNGITRELVPKEGTRISGLQASENGKALRTVEEDGLYKIYRQGADEDLTVELTYTIENGVSVYSDAAEFYWPFFDDRNESTYENLVVKIHPPSETADVIAFGYDEAFRKEQVRDDGSVLFDFGEVPAGENGDVRVAYPAELFPAAPLTADKPMKSEILQAEQELAAQEAARAETARKLSAIASVAVPLSVLILAFIILLALLRWKLKKAAAEREVNDSFFIPKQTMSIPAVIQFTSSSVLPAHLMAAGLLDLVRQGFVVKKGESFKLGVLPPTLHQHEKLLSDLLFRQVGKNGSFQFEDLASYMSDSRNHSTFYISQAGWMNAIKKEISEHRLYEENKALRWTAGLMSLLLLPFLFLFPLYSLFSWFAVALVVFLASLGFAIFYRTKTFEGLKMQMEWKGMKPQFTQLSVGEWQELKSDDQMRAYIYGVGTNDKGIMEKNDQLVKSFELPPIRYAGRYGSTEDIVTLSYIGPMAFSSFHSAQQTALSSQTSGTTGYAGGGGGGVGGGGGGSGAF
ncbi:DUF2207 domain-containing protein [Bacillus sp. FJAT-27251]|uniref:DUF2207 domain-containing protein n=1 Tax=Bacillus sp. FJAT-27251 TaxID=1684142 RepID=UPI0006A7A762|nr:DUF2207 domain-containing protein [Bacillus sp. FJAT-27251]